ncbi:zinc finger protein 510-like isoform X2 [Pleurodeles waltl]|uniref:zinc finger protein 510-like isoform X2 n=1 Tax=Pleurodeles waltl TaxID=8319 RepID=UPI0037097F62
MEQGQAKAVFADVSTSFSEEEWKLLQEWQKELYKNVMNEIHQALISLGPIITSTVHSLRAKDQEELSPVETQDSDRKYRIHCSPAQEPQELCPVETQESVNKRRIKLSPSHSAGFVNTGTHSTNDDPASVFIDRLGVGVSEDDTEHSPECEVVSFCIKDEAETFSLDPQYDTRIESVSRPKGPIITSTVHSLRAKEQEDLSPVETQDSDRKYRIHCSPAHLAGFVNTGTHSTNDDPASVFIDRLGVGVSEDDTEHSPECEVVSFCIKDEAETFSLDPQYDTRIESVSRPKGNRSMNSSAVISKTTSYKAPQVETHQNAGKKTSSKSRTWLQCDTDPCKSVFSCSTHTKLQQATSLTDRPPTYLGYESAVKNVKYLASQGKLKQHLNQFAYTENDLSTYKRDISAASQISDNDTRPHALPEHEQSFFSKKDLFIPQKTYSGETHRQCVECGKTFNKNTCLVRHKRIHTGERPFQCSECGKSFNRKEVLSRHKMIHTGVKPYQCVKCGKTFIQKTDLVRHQKVH